MLSDDACCDPLGKLKQISMKMIDDKNSTLSKYWTMDRSLRRRITRSNFQAIKRGCRERCELFLDEDFPPSSKSLSHRKLFSGGSPISWLRPHEIASKPVFIAEGASKFDVDLGEAGDPWLLAAVSSLTLTPKFLDRVVPPDQSFEYGYCGVFRFRFWQFGDWIEVLVDDRLPTVKGKLLFLHSSDPSEFWAALLEKAYAKLYGSYEALSAGLTTKALQDLTGGIVQSFTLSGHDKLLTFQVLNSAVPRSTLLIASINIDSKSNNRSRNGLFPRTAYSITGLARLPGKEEDSFLVRLKDPWGRTHTQDNNPDLLQTSSKVRPGEFWMPLSDFLVEFRCLDLVHIGPDDWLCEGSLQRKKPWRAVLARRRWRAGFNAGGCPSYPLSSASNPQFHIQIPVRGPSSGSSGGPSPHASHKCHVVVSVTQEYDCAGGSSLHHIGFAVYEVPSHLSRLSPSYLSEHEPLDVTNHSHAREVVTFFTLPPGEYIVVPQTHVPNCDGKFLLRILTDEQSNIWEVNEDNVLFRNIFAEFEEGSKIQTPEVRVLLNKLSAKYPVDIDATILLKILRSTWKTYLLEKPSLELCKSLVMLRDYNISGRLSLLEIPFILHLLQFWKTAFLKYASTHSYKTSSFNLRFILWESGVTVSNKVLECLILRFVKNKVISSESYMTVMVRLHLAHERYHSIDTKMKGNPLSLEEMILMTIYS